MAKISTDKLDVVNKNMIDNRGIINNKIIFFLFFKGIVHNRKKEEVINNNKLLNIIEGIHHDAIFRDTK